MDRVEGYIKWLYELAPIKYTGETIEAFLIRFLENQKRYRYSVSVGNSGTRGATHEGAGASAKANDGVMNLGGSSSWKDATDPLTRMLSSAAMYIVTGRKPSALYLLVELDKLLDTFTDVTDAQCQVIVYCKDVLWWQYYGMEKDKDNSQMFNARWGEMVCQSYEGEATVYYLKAMLGVKLRINDEQIKEFFWTATLMDPKCMIWHHLAYRGFRRIRGYGGYGGPSDKEWELAKAAYELSGGKHLVVVADFALMLKEFMWSKRHDQRLWDQNHQTFMDCSRVYEIALGMAKKTALYGKIKLQFAELMHFGRGPRAVRMRGKQLFDELEKESSGDSSVLHKLGNVYRDERNFELAKGFYQRALALAPSFVPLVLDYQKLLVRMQDYEEILTVVNKALSPEFQRSDRDTTKLQMERDLAIGELRKRRNSESNMDVNWRRRK